MSDIAQLRNLIWSFIMSVFLRVGVAAIALSMAVSTFAVAGVHGDPRACNDHAFRHCR